MTSRILILLAGLFGACGVAAAAYGAHGSAETRLVQPVALILLTHAPALLVIGSMAVRSGPTTVGGGLTALGAVLFCSELMVTAITGMGIVPYAAPTGGLLLIAGWIAIGAGALTSRR